NVKPSLSARPSHVVPLGQNVTLTCDTHSEFNIVMLYKEHGDLKHQFHKLIFRRSLLLGPVTPDHAGIYTCYGSYNHTPYEWSESSDPVDIKITGLYKKPSLSALMGPGVTSGENMTLSCVSDHQFDMFHLSMNGVPQGHGLPAEQSHNGTFKANFLSLPLVQAEAYRCYGSFRNSSHVWSSPSDPLYLPVSGKKVILSVSHIL
ncbi:Killer cell immunoglobulin-like receptor 3DL1, partial [Lemmus lemmus]